MSAFHPKAAIELKWASTTATDPKRTVNNLCHSFNAKCREALGWIQQN